MFSFSIEANFHIWNLLTEREARSSEEKILENQVKYRVIFPQYFSKGPSDIYNRERRLSKYFKKGGFELISRFHDSSGKVEVYGKVINDVLAQVWLTSVSSGSKDTPSGCFPVSE